MAGAFFGLTVSVDTRELERILGAVNPVSAEVLRRSAYQFESVAKANAPVDTGNLRNTIHVSKLSANAAEVQDGTEYGVYQEFGVAHPYLIDAPVNIPGVGWRYIKMHPGFAAQPFFTPAAQEVGQSYYVEFFPMLLNP